MTNDQIHNILTSLGLIKRRSLWSRFLDALFAPSTHYEKEPVDYVPGIDNY